MLHLQQNGVKYIVYLFKCPKCNKQHEISMPMALYTNKGHICTCGEELVRDIKNICTSFDTSKITGFFGKSK